MRSIAVTGIAIALWLVPAAAWASAQDQANDLSGEIMSPFCPGVTLHECPSAEAINLRDRIAQWFSGGQTRAQIMERLEDEYGRGIRAAPAVGGTGLGAWLLPIVAIAVGLGVAVLLLRRWIRTPATQVDETVVASADRARVDAELAALREPR